MGPHRPVAGLRGVRRFAPNAFAGVCAARPLPLRGALWGCAARLLLQDVECYCTRQPCPPKTGVMQTYAALRYALRALHNTAFWSVRAPVRPPPSRPLAHPRPKASGKLRGLCGGDLTWRAGPASCRSHRLRPCHVYCWSAVCACAHTANAKAGRAFIPRVIKCCAPAPYGGRGVQVFPVAV